jgi:leucine dehydrogenase
MSPGRRTRLPVMIGVHSTLLGPAVGGCRIKAYESPLDAVADCLRLSQAMTLKAAAVDNGTGGGKAVVPLPTGLSLTPELRTSVLLDIADAVHALGGTYHVAPDIGTGPEDMDIIHRRTPYVGGRTLMSGGAGGTTQGTFRGVEAALHAALGEVFGDTSVAGLQFVLIGLGGIGSLLARSLVAQGARLTVTDVDTRKKALAQELGADWTTPDKAVELSCDVLMPCAVGGVIGEANVDKVQARLVCGAANNQLAHSALATTLHARGIVFVPDYIASAGGLMYATGVELHGRSPAESERLTCEGIARNVRQVLQTAKARTCTPLQASDSLAAGRLSAAAFQS